MEMVIKRVLLFAFAIILFLALCGAATAASDFNIETAVGGESDSDWSFDGTVLTIGDGADIIITGAVDNGRCIVVESNAEVNITLDNVTIDTRNFSTSPFLLNTGADVALILKGDNFLYAGDNQAGIQTTGAALKIDGAGSLTANGGWYSAGIGGNNGNDGGTVEINGGVVKAADGWYGSIGIGGGTGSLDDGTLTMNGNGVVVTPSAASAGAKTSGILFIDDVGTFYGTSVKPTYDFPVPMYSTLTIPSGAELIIDVDLLMTNQGTVTINSGGKIEVSGEIFNYYGTINNNGGTIEIKVDGNIGNIGIINNNGGTINNIGGFGNGETGKTENNGTINNTGTITNTGAINNIKTIENSGTIDSYYIGTIDNSGTIDNKAGGTISSNNLFNNSNTGIINNTGSIGNYVGTFDNKGTINNDVNGEIGNGWLGTINNSGTIDNNGKIENVGSATINNTGTIDNTRTIDNAGTINNGGTITGTGTITGSGSINTVKKSQSGGSGFGNASIVPLDNRSIQNETPTQVPPSTNNETNISNNASNQSSDNNSAPASDNNSAPDSESDSSQASSSLYVTGSILLVCVVFVVFAGVAVFVIKRYFNKKA